MNRTGAVATAIIALGAFIPCARAEQAPRLSRIGFIYPGSKQLSPMFDVFRRELAELGYVDGKNVVIEPRFADGQYDRCPELAAELVRLKVDVIAVQGAVTVREIRKAVANTPTVFAIVVDPVAEDVVANLEHPGGNLTGVTIFDPQQPRKQVELLLKVLPGVKRLGLLGDQGIRDDRIKAVDEQARALGLETQRFRVAGPTPDLAGAFTAFTQEHADAVLVMEEPVPLNHAKEIARLGSERRLPVIFPLSGADAGGLIAYGTSLVEGYRRMAAYVDQILKGAKAVSSRSRW